MKHFRMALLFITATFLTTQLVNAERSGKPILAKTRIEKEISANKPYGFARIRGMVRAGRRAQRFEIRHGDCGASRDWSDCGNDRQRIERKEDPKGRFQRVGQQAWYGWSFFLAAGFRDIGPANTTVGQMKMRGWRTPLWHFNMRDGKATMLLGSDPGCTIGRISSLRGKWQDVVIFSDYSIAPKGPSFIMYLNGKQVCTRRKPLVTQQMINTATGPLYMKYGIYNSYVSRWLSRHKTRSVTAKAFADVHANTGHTSNSAASAPFNYDWGVVLPTQVVFYDEMRYGSSRSQVDIRMLEAAGAKPVD